VNKAAVRHRQALQHSSSLKSINEFATRGAEVVEDAAGLWPAKGRFPARGGTWLDLTDVIRTTNVLLRDTHRQPHQAGDRPMARDLAAVRSTKGPGSKPAPHPTSAPTQRARHDEKKCGGRSPSAHLQGPMRAAARKGWLPW